MFHILTIDRAMLMFRYTNAQVLRFNLNNAVPNSSTSSWAGADSLNFPLPRTGQAMCVNPVSNELVVFGGFNRGASDSLATYIYPVDLWVFNISSGTEG